MIKQKNKDKIYQSEVKTEIKLQRSQYLKYNKGFHKEPYDHKFYYLDEIDQFFRNHNYQNSPR